MNEERNKSAICAPCDGEVIKLEDVTDEVFSSGVMGDGFGVLPSSKRILSPVSGKIENAYKTGHAYTIVSDDGLDVLVHIGIDTVELEGRFFEKKVTSGEQIKKGDVLAIADIEKILEAGFDPVCVVVASNSDKMNNIEMNYGKCYSGDEVMKYVITN
ncbi:MAG: PTS glucose transporter subunit IIA [Clostridia bacterium]|nr:PTS glucose transporter subunit IIA [Clostridia bacterium]